MGNTNWETRRIINKINKIQQTNTTNLVREWFGTQKIRMIIAI